MFGVLGGPLPNREAQSLPSLSFNLAVQHGAQFSAFCTFLLDREVDRTLPVSLVLLGLYPRKPKKDWMSACLGFLDLNAALAA